MAHVTRHTSRVTRHTSHVTRHTSYVTRLSSHVTRHTSHVPRHTSHVTRHTSHLTHHTSHVTRHTVYITRHTSHVTHQIVTHPTCQIIRAFLTTCAAAAIACEHQCNSSPQISRHLCRTMSRLLARRALFANQYTSLRPPPLSASVALSRHLQPPPCLLSHRTNNFPSSCFPLTTQLPFSHKYFSFTLFFYLDPILPASAVASKPLLFFRRCVSHVIFIRKAAICSRWRIR
jgi:uncharacterized protein (DUF3084 family)